MAPDCLQIGGALVADVRRVFHTLIWSPMMQDDERGRRVRRTPEGLAITSRMTRGGPTGTIVGGSHRGDSWQILWDGLRYPQAWNKSFVEIIEPEATHDAG
jgi:hypothetical protein